MADMETSYNLTYYTLLQNRLTHGRAYNGAEKMLTREEKFEDIPVLPPQQVFNEMHALMGAYIKKLERTADEVPLTAQMREDLEFDNILGRMKAFARAGHLYELSLKHELDPEKKGTGR